MTVRALNINGDIVTSGPAQFIDDESAAGSAQNVRTRLALLSGEWFLDILDGTPWFERENRYGILGKGGTLAQRESILRRRIALSNGVAGMSYFRLAFDEPTRKMTVTSGIISKSGEQAELVFTQAAIF